MRNGWPDGLSYIEQEDVLIKVFDLIKDELIKMANEDG